MVEARQRAPDVTASRGPPSAGRTDAEVQPIRSEVARSALETNKTLHEAIGLYRSSGYAEVEPFNNEPYAHHWFEKRLALS